MLRQHLVKDQTTNKEAEITSLSSQLQEAIQDAETAKERAEAAELEAQRTAATIEEIKERAEAATIQTAKEREKAADLEAKRLEEEFVHAELQHLCDMTARQKKWEAKEQRLEADYHSYPWIDYPKVQTQEL